MSHLDAYTGRSPLVRAVPWLCWLAVLACVASVFNTALVNALSDVADEVAEEDAEANATGTDGDEVRAGLLLARAGRVASQPHEYKIEPSSTVASASTSTDIAVMLFSVDEEGTRRSVVCLTTRDRVAASVLELNPDDMATVAAHLCSSTQQPIHLGTGPS